MADSDPLPSAAAGDTTAPQRILPWRVKLFLALFSLIPHMVCRSNGTVNRCLLSLFDSRARPCPKPHRGTRAADVTVDASRNLWFRLFLPAASLNPSTARIPVILYFHGGGFVFYSAATKIFDGLGRWMCSQIPVAVVSVSYRLAPENRCPACYEDGVDVLRFLSSPGAAKGGPPLLREFFEVADLSSCFIVGDSAGGNIAHHVARRWSSAVGVGIALAGLVTLQPFFGGEERVDSEIRLLNVPVVRTDITDWMWRAFLPLGATRDHEMSRPELAVAGLGEAFPPTLVVTSGFDPLRDWQRRYYEELRRAGKEARLVEYPATFHGFYAFPDLEETPALMEELKKFMQEALAQQKKRSPQQRPEPHSAAADDHDIGKSATAVAQGTSPSGSVLT